MQLINFFTQLLIMVGSAFLGSYLNMDTLYIAVSTIIILAEGLLISFLINAYTSTKDSLEKQSTTVAQELLKRRMNGENTADVTIFPESNSSFDAASFSNFTITVNTPLEIADSFDLQLLVDQEVKLKVAGNNTIDPKYHSGRFMFLISGNFSTKVMGKYQKYDVSIMPSEKGKQFNFEVIAQNQEMSGAKSFHIISV